MKPRFTIGSVTGFPEVGTRERTLWYVFDDAPPRHSHFAGFGDQGQALAQQMADRLNREYAR